MKIKDYQTLALIPTGSTYMIKVAEYFGLDTNLEIDIITEMISNLTKLKEKELKEYVVVKGKKYIWEKNLKKVSIAQFTQLETILAENDNVKNINSLLAIFCRPYKRFILKRYIQPYTDKDQENIANDFLEMEMEDAQALLLFFYQYVEDYMLNMKILYLAQVKKT